MHTVLAAAIIQLVLVVGAYVPATFAGTSLRDDVFEQIPFDRWRSEGNQSVIPWSVDVIPPELSSHQRLLVGVKIQVDVSKFAKHHRKERLLALVQFEDADRTVWRTHSFLNRESGGEIDYIQNAFVLPGDYVLSVAVCDAAGLQHSFAGRKLHVPALKADPLPNSWDGLPRVEFLRSGAESPDAWFLPDVNGRLHLPIQTHHPVHIDVLLNTTPGDRVSDPVGGLRRNMSVLIPALKVISQMELRNGPVGLGSSMDVAFLDLTHRQAVGVQNWEDMKKFFAGSNPGIVDVKALDGQWKMRSFFFDQVIDRIEASQEAERIVIVLSGPAFYADQEPASLSTAGQIGLPQGVVPRVFYIRCREIPRSILAPRPRPGVRPKLPRRAAFALPLDDLELPLEKSGARLYDVITAEQFRRVLADVIRQISRI